ncbi:MAG TPA: response regulator, partial [Methylomirabilota bacterium]|nr:response regulator [Methylomirabilota bacterium]
AGYEVEAFASVSEFLARAPFEGPGCLLLDVRMPGRTGLDLQETLRAAERRLSIVFITGHGDVGSSVTAMKGGAVDFLTKPLDEEALLTAIRLAVGRTIDEQAEQGRVTAVRNCIATLTPREAEVFALVVTGMLNKQIGAQLGIVEKTVKVHRARVMEKMQAGSLAQLVQLAGTGGIIAARA